MTMLACLGRSSLLLVATLTSACGSGSTSAAPGSEPPRGAVIVNGTPLSSSALEDFRARYGAYPAVGEWWYDAQSGLYGAKGGAASGFMYPGHDFGALPADCAEGTSGVFLNGRQLPEEEVTFFALLIGSQILPGRYWLDGVGNCGMEISPLPLGNLYAIVQARLSSSQGAAGGGGGDNIWSSMLGAGNYNADNSQGYVSVPGVGPVSYGM